MASEYTTNYELPLWAAEDAFLREEFNEAHEKIDTALGALGCVVGTYAGNGTNGRSISLGFQPKAVLIAREGGVFNWGGTYGVDSEGALALVGHPAKNNANQQLAAVTETGFQVWNNGVNESGKNYYYLAMR